MKYLKYRSLLIWMLTGGFTAQAQQRIKWPDHKKAAIILTYDDALESQLNVAIPQLEARHLKATFFVTGDLNYATLPRWRALANKGYELGNHTIFHPCLPSNDNPVSSNNYTAYGMIREIEEMNRFLFAVDGRSSRTFAYPCTETLAGGKDYVDTLRKYGLVKYARAGGDDNAVITDFKQVDPLRVPSYGLEGGNSGAQLIAFVKKVQRAGGMGVIMLHGVGGDYIAISARAHRVLLDYLVKNRSAIWVPTFQQGMNYAGRKVLNKRVSESAKTN